MKLSKSERNTLMLNKIFCKGLFYLVKIYEKKLKMNWEISRLNLVLESKNTKERKFVRNIIM